MKESSANLETSQQQQQIPTEKVGEPKPPVNNAGGTPNNVQEKQKPKTLEELFGDTQDKTSTEIALDDEDDPDAPVDSIDRLMKKHGLTAEQAYAIKIPMPNGGESLTIGALKDKIADLADFETRETVFEERRIKAEGELLRAQAEIRDLISVLPENSIKPEVLQKLRERQAATVRREHQLTLEHISEWQDDHRRTADMTGMIEMLSDYGFDNSFLESVVDHRAMKFIRDSYLIRKRIQKALASVRDPEKKGARPSGGKSAAQKPVARQQRQQKMPTQRDRIMTYLQSKETK